MFHRYDSIAIRLVFSLSTLYSNMYAVNDRLYCGCTPVVHVYSYSVTHSDC